jgi:hypothetical protein
LEFFTGGGMIVEHDSLLNQYKLYQLANHPVNIATNWVDKWMHFTTEQEFKDLSIYMQSRIDNWP